MFKEDKLPVKVEQLPTGTILVYPEQPQQQSVALYARVSSSDQKDDLQRQLHRLRDYASAHGLRISKEVSSGRTRTSIQLLSDSDRFKEIARMLGGE